MELDRPAGEGLGWWQDQYAAVENYLPVVLRYFEGNSLLSCFIKGMYKRGLSFPQVWGQFCGVC